MHASGAVLGGFLGFPETPSISIFLLIVHKTFLNQWMVKPTVTIKDSCEIRRPLAVVRGIKFLDLPLMHHKSLVLAKINSNSDTLILLKH